MPTQNWAVSTKHRRWLDLDALPWLNQSVTEYINVPCNCSGYKRTAKCGVLTFDVIENAYRDWAEEEKVPVSQNDWPWKGIFKWFAEVGDEAVFLVSDTARECPRPWQEEIKHKDQPRTVIEGWVKDSLFYADGGLKDFKEMPEKGFVTIDPSPYL
jgi:hypothetical protein